MSTQRQPKGIPIGGQFAASAHDEAALPLADHDGGMTWTRSQPALPNMRLNSLRYTSMNFTTDHGLSKYDTNPPYQRGSVWSLEQRHDLMRSLLMGIPIGAVIVNKRSYNEEENIRVFGSPKVYAIIDGKQRLETVIAYHQGEFSIPADWWDDKSIDPSRVRSDGTVTYDDLTDYGKRTFDMFPIPTEEASVRSLRAEATIFRLVNTGGTEQTEDTLANAARVEGGSRGA